MQLTQAAEFSVVRHGELAGVAPSPTGRVLPGPVPNPFPRAVYWRGEQEAVVLEDPLGLFTDQEGNETGGSLGVGGFGEGKSAG